MDLERNRNIDRIGRHNFADADYDIPTISYGARKVADKIRNVREETIMRTLTVEGKGEVTVTPDVCKYSLRICKKHSEYFCCYKELNDDGEKLRNLLVKAGIAEGSIKTGKYSVVAVTAYSRKLQKELPDGYEGIQKVNVEIPLDKKLMNTVLNAVANGFSDDLSISISFGVSDMEAIRKQLIRNSVAAAKSNAETIADAGVITLGQIVSVEYGRNIERFGNDDVYDIPTFLRKESDAVLSIVPADITSTDTVTVAYEIL